MPTRLPWLIIAASVVTTTSATAARVPEEPMRELPILTWQQEAELLSTVRQVLMNTYLPYLARPTDFRAVHNDAIPNDVADWNWHRPEVQNQLRARQDSVDAQRRSHAAMPDAELNALIGKKQAFRPEQLEQLLTKSPRFDDIVVVVKRVQPLGATASGGEVYRVDFEVKTLSGGVSETTTFERIDVINNLGTWLMPTTIVLEVAPIARAGTAVATNAGPADLARSAIAVVLATARDLSPITIPRLPIIE
jgi:hypothetical protein